MTEKPKNVRLATKADEQQIYDILMELYAENALFSLSSEKVWSVIRRATERKGGIIGVIDGPNGIEGSVGLELTQFWYSDDWLVSEYWNFVREPFRKTTNAVDLINFAKWSVENIGLPLHMGIITTKRTAAKERLYRRVMPKVGAFFVHNLQGIENLISTTEDGEQ